MRLLDIDSIKLFTYTIYIITMAIKSFYLSSTNYQQQHFLLETIKLGTTNLLIPGEDVKAENIFTIEICPK